jgi:hypothetical protein
VAANRGAKLSNVHFRRAGATDAAAPTAGRHRVSGNLQKYLLFLSAPDQSARP